MGLAPNERWRHKIGAADASTILLALPTKSSPDKASGVGPQDRRGKALEQKANRLMFRLTSLLRYVDLCRRRADNK